MYKLIGAKQSHAQQILHFFSITCYWKEFVEGNTQDKSYEDFMLEWVVYPRINITKVLVALDNEEKIYGCLIAGTMDEFSQMPDYTPYLNPRVLDVFGPWFSYPVADDSLILELYAVDNEAKGKGYGKLMLNETEELAKNNNLSRISCFVWTCFHDSIITTTKYGFTIVDCLKFADPIDIGLLYMEKSSVYIARKDYFQSNSYIKQTGMLL